jgi:hypothetical protein
MKEQAEAGYWLTAPSGEGLTILGVAGRYRREEDGINAARAEAARKLSFFHGLRGKTLSVNHVGSGNLDWYSATDTDFEYDREFEKYMEMLSYNPEEDVLTADGAVYVRFSCGIPLPGDLRYPGGKNRDGSPSWTTRPPAEIGGYQAGVGYARPQQRAGDTHNRSYEAAAAYIIAQLSSSAEAGEAEMSGEGRASSSWELSEGELVNFYVLETWREPDTGALWTLAIAKPR